VAAILDVAQEGLVGGRPGGRQEQAPRATTFAHEAPV
jgi:hypothetical protein